MTFMVIASIPYRGADLRSALGHGALKDDCHPLL